jgi:predicted DNA-binding protein
MKKDTMFIKSKKNQISISLRLDDEELKILKAIVKETGRNNSAIATILISNSLKELKDKYTTNIS